YCRYLNGQGWKARSVSGALECLWKVSQAIPKVLVLDHELPWGDGEGVIGCLREENFNLPVIVTTWNTSQTFARRVISPPVVACLTKFFPLEKLRDAVGNAMNRIEMVHVLGDNARGPIESVR
ncbi:MAG: response regulator, partial [Gemmataceae bacterium]